MSDLNGDEPVDLKERSCGSCAGCVLLPVIFLLLTYILVMLEDYFSPGTNWDGGFALGFIGLPLLLVTGAILGATFSKQLVGLLKEIKWRLWDS